MFLNNYKQEGIHQKGGMTSIKGQTKNLGFNPKPNYNFLPSGDKLNFLDSANYQYDFYNTPLLGTTPSRVDMKVPAYNSDYSDPSYQNYSDLQWLMNHSLPHSRYHFYNDGKDNLYKRTVEESNAYEDYLNQFFNHAGKLINSNPNMKHFLNKATPFKFKKGGIFYQDGGMTDAEAKVFYKNPRYVKSLADAERQGFIGPENYPPELEDERRPFIGPRQEMDRMQMVPAPELLRNDSGLPRQPLFIPKPVVRQAPRRKSQPRANNNAEMAKIAGIRMAYLDMMNPKNFAKKPQVNKVQYSDIYSPLKGKGNISQNKKSNLVRNTAIGLGISGAGALGTLGYLGYYHPEFLQKHIPTVYKKLPNYDGIVNQYSNFIKESKKLANQSNQYAKGLYSQRPIINIPNLNLKNIPEKVGTKLYQYPQLKSTVNAADKSYRQLEKLTNKTIKRLFR